MKPIFLLRIPSGSTAITFGPSWLVVAPAAIGTIALVYVPILGAALSHTQAWTVSVAIAGLGGISLIGHVEAHVWAAQATGSNLPGHIPLYPLGGAAQVWPASPSAWRDALVAGAGPAVSLLLAGLAYLVWNAQLNPYLNVITFFPWCFI